MVNIQRYGGSLTQRPARFRFVFRTGEDQVMKDDLLVLAAFGGGFTWGARSPCRGQNDVPQQAPDNPAYKNQAAIF